MKLPQPDTEYAKTCMALLGKLMDGKITWAEYNKEWSYLVLEVVPTLWPKAMPHRPSEMQGYDSLSNEDKVAASKDPIIREYWAEYTRAANWNKAQVYMMEEALNCLPQEDVVSREKVKDRIARFQMEEEQHEELRRKPGPYRDYDGERGRKVPGRA